MTSNAGGVGSRFAFSGPGTAVRSALCALRRIRDQAAQVRSKERQVCSARPGVSPSGVESCGRGTRDSLRKVE